MNYDQGVKWSNAAQHFFKIENVFFKSDVKLTNIDMASSYFGRKVCLSFNLNRRNYCFLLFAILAAVHLN